MPIRKSDYPPNWKEISLRVREREGNCCKWCGAPNGKVVERHPSGPRKGEWFIVEFVLDPSTYAEVPTDGMTQRELRRHGITRIVLSTAHLDRNTKNNSLENLAALCQRCHLNYDRAAQHIPNRKYGREHQKQPKLFHYDGKL